jgi:hypothetical protein
MAYTTIRGVELLAKETIKMKFFFSKKHTDFCNDMSIPYLFLLKEFGCKGVLETDLLIFFSFGLLLLVRSITSPMVGAYSACV